MKFDRNLVLFKGDEVFYDDIKLSITRKNIQDYTLQTGLSGELIILFYYKKELQQIRDKILDNILNTKDEAK